MNVQQNRVNQLYRTSFPHYLRRVFSTLYPGKQFINAQYVELICDRMESMARGERKRELIAMPPRYLKSTIVSVAYATWRMGRDPNLRILVASYSLDLAAKLSRECRLVISQQWYRRAFPEFRVDASKNTELEFHTTARGYRKAISVEGGVTGYGADIIICDDLLKPDDAKRSPTVRQKVRDYFDETLFSRLDDKENGEIIVLQQRVHREDMIGHLLEKGTFGSLILPAIAVEDECYPMSNGRVFVRRKGEALFPEGDPLPNLANTKASMGHAPFEAQYQQDPLLLGAGYVDWAWFKTYDRALPRTQYHGVIQSWDLAQVQSEKRDYSVGMTFGLIGDVWHLIDVVRGRWTYPELKQIIQMERRKWMADIVLIEHAGSGISMYQELRQIGFPARPVVPQGNKIERFEGVTGRIADGDLLIPRQAHFLAEFRREIMEFPAGSHDDQVDALSQFLSWVRRPEFVVAVLDRAKNGRRATSHRRRAYSPPSLRQRILDSYNRDAPSLPFGGF